MRASMLTILLTTAATLSLGCGTISSYANGCPAVFSGVRTDVEYLDDYNTWNDAFDLATVSLDVPLSAVVDTVTLPIAALINGHPDQAYGCGWAASNPALAQRSNR